MSRSVSIAGQNFTSKAKAKQFFGDIRHRYADDERLGDDDAELIYGLLTCHPEAGTKIGVGVLHFSVKTDTIHGHTRHFVLHRIDGTSTDFSFHACIDGRNEKRDRLEALRQAITPQILEFRDRCFATNATPICPLSRVRISLASYHVDHQAPLDFQSLVARWLEAESITLDDVQISPPQDNQLVTHMTDTAQIASWCAFHKRLAKLRLLSPRANLSDAKRIP